MNEYDVERAVERFAGDPVLGPAARLLADYVDEVNRCSDGWPYWRPPAHAAHLLMTLLQAHLNSGLGSYPRVSAPTRDDVRRTFTPIKRFMTQRGHAAGMRLTYPTL